MILNKSNILIKCEDVQLCSDELLSCFAISDNLELKTLTLSACSYFLLAPYNFAALSLTKKQTALSSNCSLTPVFCLSKSA